jgi:hypothetical protein
LVVPTPVFKTGAFNHSAIFPGFKLKDSPGEKCGPEIEGVEKVIFSLVE